MLSKTDRIFIMEVVTGAITKNNEILIKEMIELFNVTNERMDMLFEKLDKKIDNGLEKLNEQQSYLNDHERRIEKMEEKVYN